MQRPQRHQFLDPLEHGGVDPYRPIEPHAAVHHPMPDHGKVVLAGMMRHQPVVNDTDRAGMVGRGSRFVRDLRLERDRCRRDRRKRESRDQTKS